MNRSPLLALVVLVVLTGGRPSRARRPLPRHGPDRFAWNFREQRIGGSARTRSGHCRVVRAVLRGLAAYRRRNPEAPPVAVGDLGLRHGGEIDEHATHENGRQIDLYVPRQSAPAHPNPRRVRSGPLAPRRHLHAMF